MPNRQTEDEAKRAFTHGSSGATADMASDKGGAIEEHRHVEAPASRQAEPLKEGEKPDHMAQREAEAEDRQEALLDEAIEETFPGSDPISPKHIT
ncbi:hypothetical protein ACO2Q0_13785 [Phenylobacterium sp. VNQ135]|uniref:hypothetical protein n=1 Tax=Phenylobacterium sp. VNQ135 TaxID=3400922 RepID=UPI003C127BEB